MRMLLAALIFLTISAQPFSRQPVAAGTLWAAETAPPSIGFQQRPGELVITVAGQPLASYVYQDAQHKIPRPYFAHVKAPGGVQVTRHHPPVAGQDRMDHEALHPGIWLAFGDLDGTDFWRNKAQIAHVRFIKPPQGGAGRGSFVEEKEYRRADQSVICTETFHCRVHALKDGFLLIWDSAFRSADAFYFGDQEEMGLGVRVATPLSEIEGGRLSDSTGRRGASAIWSHSAAWCDYSGIKDGQWVGMTLMCHPENFRESWMHARNYGFVAANPFGRAAMQKGPPSRVVVQPGETLRLRYAVWIHAGQLDQQSAKDRQLRSAAAYADYLKLVVPN